MKPEGARRAYIRLLSERGDIAESAEAETRDAILYAELIDRGYVRGTAVRDASHGGMTVGAAVTEITLEGRLFLQQLKAQEKQESVTGRVKSSWPMFSGFILAILGWGLGLLTPMIQQRLYPHIQQQNPSAYPANPAQQIPAQANPVASPNHSIAPVPTKP